MLCTVLCWIYPLPALDSDVLGVWELGRTLHGAEPTCLVCVCAAPGTTGPGLGPQLLRAAARCMQLGLRWAPSPPSTCRALQPRGMESPMRPGPNPSHSLGTRWARALTTALPPMAAQQGPWDSSSSPSSLGSLGQGSHRRLKDPDAPRAPLAPNLPAGHCLQPGKWTPLPAQPRNKGLYLIHTLLNGFVAQ